jgi:hypothetical protein
MELEFDKEMDSLLRKTGEAKRGVLVGDVPNEKPKVHLDADQLSAFAENAIPEKSRALYMSHLADCDRCRRILSGLITLNAEAMPAEDRVIAPVISPAAMEPWYRRLLLPNLAYVMGGLVLAFGGLIAISVFQFSDGGEATVSQSVETAPAARGPMFADGQAVTDQMANTNSASMAANKPEMAQSANAASSAVNTASNTSPTGAGADKLAKETSPRDQPGYSADGVDAAKPTAAAPVMAPQPPAPSMAAPKREDAEMNEVAASEMKDDDRKSRAEAKMKTAEGQKADLSINSRQVQDLPRTQAGGVAKAAPGPSRESTQNFPNRANNTSELFEEKRVSGKGFQRRNNVWYDNSYRGQATTNVKRGTDEYRKLDSGLRSIAESLSGVVVVVWTGKAYRIQ